MFVAPLLVLASAFIGPQPMDLLFGKGLVLAVFLAVVITGQVASDGRSDWLKGVQLLAVYPDTRPCLFPNSANLGRRFKDLCAAY